MIVNGMTVGASESLKNTYIGKNALASVTNGMFVVAVGEDALKNSAEGGAYNTAIGYNAGGDLTTGSGNTIIGYQAQASSPSVTNEVTLGGPDVTSTRLWGTVTANGTPLTTALDVDTAIDKKLAIKDKLIEKLSARLDELEKKVK